MRSFLSSCSAQKLTLYSQRDDVKHKNPVVRDLYIEFIFIACAVRYDARDHNIEGLCGFVVGGLQSHVVILSYALIQL